MSTIDSYSALPPQQRFRFSASRLPAVIGLSVIAVFISLAAIYYLSVLQLIVVAVAGALLMAMFYRISNIQSFAATYSTAKLDCSDGGAFSINQSTPVKKQAQPVVSDGGSFERSSVSKTK